MPDPSDSELLDELKSLYQECGRTPTRAMMVGKGAYSPDVFEDRFDSWEAALTAAGLDPDRLDEERYLALQYLDEDRLKMIGDYLDSNDPKAFFRGQLLAELHRLATELEKTPSGPDMAEYGRHSYHSYVKYFGTWNGAIEQLGLTPNNEKYQISQEELFEELRRIAEKKGSRPNTTDMEVEGKYSYPTYIYRFGSWEAACDAAGV